MEDVPRPLEPDVVDVDADRRAQHADAHRLDGAFSAVSDLGEPGHPHRLIAGLAWPDGVVGLDALRAWYAAAALSPDQGAALQATGMSR